MCNFVFVSWDQVNQSQYVFLSQPLNFTIGQTPQLSYLRLPVWDYSHPGNASYNTREYNELLDKTDI